YDRGCRQHRSRADRADGDLLKEVAAANDDFFLVHQSFPPAPAGLASCAGSPTLKAQGNIDSPAREGRTPHRYVRPASRAPISCPRQSARLRPPKTTQLIRSAFVPI